MEIRGSEELRAYQKRKRRAKVDVGKDGGSSADSSKVTYAIRRVKSND